MMNMHPLYVFTPLNENAPGNQISAVRKTQLVVSDQNHKSRVAGRAYCTIFKQCVHNLHNYYWQF